MLAVLSPVKGWCVFIEKETVKSFNLISFCVKIILGSLRAQKKNLPQNVRENNIFVCVWRGGVEVEVSEV